MAVPVELVSMGLDVGGDLSLQRRREHLPGTVTDQFIQQRPTHPAGACLEPFSSGTTVNMGVPSRTSTPNAGPDQSYRTSDHPREGAPPAATRPRTIHRF